MLLDHNNCDCIHNFLGSVSCYVILHSVSDYLSTEPTYVNKC
jgi:hypothetical protein